MSARLLSQSVLLLLLLLLLLYNCCGFRIDINIVLTCGCVYVNTLLVGTFLPWPWNTDVVSTYKTTLA